jgi:hypothetical protein
MSAFEPEDMAGYYADLDAAGRHEAQAQAQEEAAARAEADQEDAARRERLVNDLTGYAAVEYAIDVPREAVILDGEESAYAFVGEPGLGVSLFRAAYDEETDDDDPEIGSFYVPASLVSKLRSAIAKAEGRPC